MAFVWSLDEPQIVQVQMVRTGGWTTDTKSKVCLDVLSCQQEVLDPPGPPLTSNLSCQRHFLECPVKINMWDRDWGLREPIPPPPRPGGHDERKDTAGISLPFDASFDELHR